MAIYQVLREIRVVDQVPPEELPETPLTREMQRKTDGGTSPPSMQSPTASHQVSGRNRHGRLADDGKRTDARIVGNDVRSRDSVFPTILAANRDPTVFDRPDALILDRSPNPHVSFGFGHHFCLGAALARLEARIALPLVLRRFPDIRLDGPVRWRETMLDRSQPAFVSSCDGRTPTSRADASAIRRPRGVEFGRSGRRLSRRAVPRVPRCVAGAVGSQR